MKLYALLLKELEEHKGFAALLLGGTLLLEAYAVIRLPEHLGGLFVAVLPFWGLLLLVPARFVQSSTLERRGQTHHLLHALPVPRWVPVACKVLALGAIGSAALGVALGSLLVIHGRMQGVLSMPGFPQVDGMSVVGFVGLGTAAGVGLLLGAAVAFEGVRGSVRRYRWLGSAGFLVGAFLAFFLFLPDGLRLFISYPILGTGFGRSFFAYALTCGLISGLFGLVLVEHYSEVS